MKMGLAVTPVGSMGQNGSSACVLLSPLLAPQQMEAIQVIYGQPHLCKEAGQHPRGTPQE